eukprot:Skav229675  [mRNA]  locus=scaffold4264:90502:91214:- [translate_table: standard]
MQLRPLLSHKDVNTSRFMRCVNRSFDLVDSLTSFAARSAKLIFDLLHDLLLVNRCLFNLGHDRHSRR